MSRFPNPWVAIPVLIAAVAGGAIGYLVTDASCAPGSCAVAAGLVATFTAIATGVGTAVIAVLAIRSLSEWREHSEREITISQEREGPPTC